MKNLKYLTFIYLVILCLYAPLVGCIKPDSLDLQPAKEKVSTFLLLPGLGGDASYLEAMQTKLRQAFPSSEIHIIVPQSGTDSNTTIETQATQLYEQIDNLNLQGKDVSFVGHSMGGLRVFTLIKQYREALKRKDIHIKSLCTIGTPWEGIAMLKDSSSRQNISGLVQLMSSVPQFKGLADYDPNKPSVQDLIPNSTFLEQVARDLATNPIPIQAIGSCSDGIVALSSQHANKIASKQNFNIEYVQGVLHWDEPTDDRIIQKVISFLKDPTSSLASVQPVELDLD